MLVEEEWLMARSKRDPKKGTGKKPKGSGRRLYIERETVLNLPKQMQELQ